MTDLGIRLTETMTGWFALDEEDPRRGAEVGERTGQRLAMHVDAVIARLDAFLSDPEQGAELRGSIEFAPLGKGMVSERGAFKLYSPAGVSGMKYMVYELVFRQGGKHYTLAGRKEVGDVAGLDIWPDTTTLYARLHAGGDTDAPVIGAGILRLGVREVLDLLSTLEVTGARSDRERARACATFGRLFFGELWEIYRRHVT